VQIPPLLTLLAQTSQSFDARRGSELQRRAVWRTEHAGAGAQALFGALPRGRENGPPIELLAGQEPIGRLRLRPALTRLREARGRVGRQVLGQAHPAPAHALISPLSTAQLLVRPTPTVSLFGKADILTSQSDLWVMGCTLDLYRWDYVTPQRPVRDHYSSALAPSAPLRHRAGGYSTSMLLTCNKKLINLQNVLYKHFSNTTIRYSSWCLVMALPDD
jgi:hypothetical protein